MSDSPSVSYEQAVEVVVVLSRHILVKCLQCRGSAAQVAACQEKRCALQPYGPGLALMALPVGGDDHANSH